MNDIERQHRLLQHRGSTTHYAFDGDSGPVVVLVPGSTLPLAVWEPLIEPLIAAGFRVLRYDLPGRGHSSPYREGRADLDAHVGQIADLLDSLNLSEPVSLIGLASGCILAAAFAQSFRARVDKIVLIAPDGVATRFSPGERLVLAPLIGDLLLPLLASRLLLGRADRYSTAEPVRERVRELLRFVLRPAHFPAALLASVRQLPIHDGETWYRRIAESRVPTRVIWGADDRITPTAASAQLARIFGSDAVFVLDGVGHLPFVEDPQRSAALVVGHLRAAD